MSHKKTSVWSHIEKKTKLEKYDFAKMKEAATHPDAVVRKQAFKEYFERFEEFPSFLFDNEAGIDQLFLETILEIEKDKDSSPAILKGIGALKQRLSF